MRKDTGLEVVRPGPSLAPRRRARRPRTVHGLPGPPPPAILLLEADPYLAFVLRMGFPRAEVVEVEPGADPEDVVADVAIVDLDGRRASEFLAAGHGFKVVGICDAARAAGSIPFDLDGLVLRPYSPAELHRAVRRALGIPEPGAGGPPVGGDRLAARLGLARVAAVALAAGLQVAGSEQPAHALVLAAVVVYTALRLVRRSLGRTGAGADAGVAALAIALTGGPASAYLGLAVVAAVETGFVFGARWGSAAGIAIAAGSAFSVLGAARLETLEPERLVGWIVLFPLAAVTGSYLSRLVRPDPPQSNELLAETNRVLSSLFRIARAMPGGLDVRRVVAAALEEIEDSLGAPAGAVLLREAGLLSVAGAVGMEAEAEPVVVRGEAPEELAEGGPRVVRASWLPGPLPAMAGAHDCWLLAPLRREGVTFGFLAAACSDHGRHEERRLILRHLAEETAMAVENARLFSQVRELSADEERARLARDLHDGVAQALTHVRLELEFLARHGGASEDSVRRDAARLARVVDRALGDVRSAIQGLRAAAPGEGLGASLRSYLRDLQRLGGPEIVFDGGVVVGYPPEVEAEVFRIAQEAVSNALRHARASRIGVSLGMAPEGLRLTVEDDGIGLRPGAAPAPGLGLRAMRERSQRLGARLTLGRGSRGGTRIDLLVEEGPAAEAPTPAVRLA